MFYISIRKAWLDGKHVVFGNVVDGIDVIKAMEAVGSQSGKTSVSNRFSLDLNFLLLKPAF